MGWFPPNPGFEGKRELFFSPTNQEGENLAEYLLCVQPGTRLSALSYLTSPQAYEVDATISIWQNRKLRFPNFLKATKTHKGHKNQLELETFRKQINSFLSSGEVNLTAFLPQSNFT